MSDDQSIPVYYPLWVQVLSIVGIPALTGCSLWLISRPIWEEGIGTAQFAAGAALGLAVLYQCIIGWRTLRYIRVRMRLSADALEIVSDSSPRKLSWEQLATPKEYTFAGATRFDLRDGEILLYAFDNMKNLDEVKDMIAHHMSAATD